MLGPMAKYRRHPMLWVSTRIIVVLLLAYVIYVMLQQR
jgi:hypothetical protein